MWNLDYFKFQTPVADLDLLSIMVVRTECDLELALFMLVAPTCLLLVPLMISSSMSYSDDTISSERPST